MAKEWTGLGTAVLKIDADASGVADGVKKAEGALGKLGDSVKSQDENLKKYGDKLGKSFGPGEGLQGKLGKLETPLRDTEGAIARSQMAFVEFGKAGATASDKVGAGFLLLRWNSGLWLRWPRRYRNCCCGCWYLAARLKGDGRNCRL